MYTSFLTLLQIYYKEHIYGRKKIKVKTKYVILYGALVILFPVILTMLLGRINSKPENDNNIVLSGKYVILSDDTVTKKIDVEYFIPCVLMAQLPIDSPQELLKAQAVVIRTYIINKMGKKDSINAKELSLPYISYGKLREMWFAKYKKNNLRNIRGILCNISGMGKSIPYRENTRYLYGIIKKTNGMVLKSNGEIILPLFHQTSNGQTRSGSEVLGKKYEYLKREKCGNDIQQENYIGIKYFETGEFGNVLKEQGIIAYKDKKEIFVDKNVSTKELLGLIDISNRDKSGYVKIVKIGDTVVEGGVFAKALGLQSTDMTIEEYEKGIRITTKGVGHGFGMSLTYGAGLAGEGKTWKEILERFYDASIVEN